MKVTKWALSAAIAAAWLSGSVYAQSPTQNTTDNYGYYSAEAAPVIPGAQARAQYASVIPAACACGDAPVSSCDSGCGASVGCDSGCGASVGCDSGCGGSVGCDSGCGGSVGCGGYGGSAGCDSGCGGSVVVGCSGAGCGGEVIIMEETIQGELVAPESSSDAPVEVAPPAPAPDAQTDA